MTYRYAGAHPHELASGRPLALGDEVSLSPEEVEHSHNARLIERGLLLERPEPEPEPEPDQPKARPRTRNPDKEST